MSKRAFRTWALIGFLVIGAGVAMLKYTREEDREHHLEWAAEKGLPEPSATLENAGWGAVGLGAVLIFGALRSHRKGD